MALFDNIFLGTLPDDDTGDNARVGGQKINDNFAKAANITEGNTFTAGNTFAGGDTFTGKSTFGGEVEIRRSSGHIMLIDTATADKAWDIRVQTGSFKIAEFGAVNFWLDVAPGGLTKMPGVYANTTANAASVHVSTDGSLLRSTSSEKLKKDIKAIDPKYSEKIFEVAKKAAIHYKSKCKGDNPDHTFYGISAEKLAEIEPRLVHWGYWPEDYEIVKEEKVLKKGAKLSPVGVQYDRFVPLILVEMEKQQSTIDSLIKRIEKLEKK